MTLQAFLVEDGEPIFFEVNPRFGGGFPLGYAAGANYPEWILQMLEGKTVAPRLAEYKKGVYMTRYYKEVIVEEPLWQN
jgi:carbamoyl-phosphate synthase large subunit